MGYKATLLSGISCWCLIFSVLSQPSSPLPGFHLTARPWEPLETDKSTYLDAIEGIVRVAVQHQDSSGAIFDPYLNREHQYSTPYYAHALGTLLDAGRCKDLLASGVASMDKSLDDLATGYTQIPDAHGEFYLAAIAEAIDLYQPFISAEKYTRWNGQAATPLATIMRDQTGRLNNWRTYAMKGEWLRAERGLVDIQSAIDFIEYNWHQNTQRERMANDAWNLYQDWSSDPQSHAVEAVGRGNLTALALSGYNGPSSTEIRRMILRGGQTALLLQSPAGQCPPNGRTDNHIFNDILYQLIFEALAEYVWSNGDRQLAGQYRRAALLAFQSIQRWKRADEPWEGSFYITKNYYDPGQRVGYQPASQWGNYSGAMMFHLAEAYRAHQTDIPEVPSPVEIGGYVLKTDPRFSTLVANAGGMQVFVNLRGDEVPKYGIYWSPLGTVRFSRTGWDDRLGPSDGGRVNIYSNPDIDPDTPDHLNGLTLGPAWKEGDHWIRLADMARHYRGIVRTEFVHPLLIKFKIVYTYVTGAGGPYFEQTFTVSPDGVLTRLRCLQPRELGLTVPLLVDDGRPLQHTVEAGIASTQYPAASDQQHFIGLNSDIALNSNDSLIQSTYGKLMSVRYTTQDSTIDVFVYPRSAGDPEATRVKESFNLRDGGFSSVLGTVSGTLYRGRFSAGGLGKSIDLNEDGKDDLLFDRICHFIVQHDQGKAIAVEVDRNISMTYKDKSYDLEAFKVLKME